MPKSHKPQRRPADAAGIGPYARERERLVRLGEMRGWNVIDGESDIRSWEVKTLSGKLLGSVKELLVDPSAGEVVMIDIDLAGSDQRALLPIRLAEIDRARRIVRADSGDLEVVDGAGPVDPVQRAQESPGAREIRYADASGERVVERRPIVDEAVRRREPDTGESRL